MTYAEKKIIVSWFNHIEQIACDRKTANGFVMTDRAALDEIRVICKDSIFSINTFMINHGKTINYGKTNQMHNEDQRSDY